MPSIQKIQITSFRNIGQESLEPAPRLNLLFGKNGSGKSSILEAIYFLGLGRSFRNTQQTPLIQHGKRDCSVFAVLTKGITLGVGRSLDNPPLIKIQGNKVASAAELARHLPLQLLNAEAFKLLEGGPKARRQFLDWGVFHVEHQYHNQWREIQRCLQNRNMLLKKQAPISELEPWTAEFIRLSHEIHSLRESYLNGYLPVLERAMSSLVVLDEFNIAYSRGWNEDEEIADVLQQNLEKDLSYGFTTAGPHRADLKIKIGRQYAGDILSRGQQKLLVSAMKLAQSLYLEETTQQKCLFLIDDLPAELDSTNRVKVCHFLFELGGQAFITGNERGELVKSIENPGVGADQCKLFHVKHGRIGEVEMAREINPGI